jgi:hypothetical protein
VAESESRSRATYRPIDILTREIAIEVTGVVGASPALWYFRYIASIFLTLHKHLWVDCDEYAEKLFLYTSVGVCGRIHIEIDPCQNVDRTQIAY